MINQNLKIDLIPGGGPKIVRVSQYDHDSRNIIVTLFNNKSAYTIPTGTTVQVRGTKPSGKGFLYSCSFNDNVVTVVVKDQMTAESGKVRCEIVLINGNAILGSANFELLVERSSFDPGTVTSSDTFESLVEDAVVKCANEKLIELYVDVELSETSEAPVANKVICDNFANALKGHLSGTNITADDISPIEHNLKVLAHGKNMSKNSEMLIDNGLAYAGKGLAFKGIVGEKYTVSANFEQLGTTTQIGLSIATVEGKFIIEDYSRNASGTIKLSFVYPSNTSGVNINFFSNLTPNAVEGAKCQYNNIQIENGNNATDYMEYTDPSTITITSNGKTFTPNTEGMVEGISSSMLKSGLTASNNMIIDCEYNRDSTKVVNKLIDAITALGGSV